MLVLGRKAEEHILIGDNIVTTVGQIRGNQVRLGIEAPADILVLREEMKLNEQNEPVEPET